MVSNLDSFLLRTGFKLACRIFKFFGGPLQTILRCIVGELAEGEFVAVAVAVSEI